MAVDDDDDRNFKPQRRKKGGTADPVLAYLAAADEDGVVLSSMAKEECGSRRRKKGRDAWHALRKAFYDTSLMKKILRIKKTKKDSTSRSNSNTESETINKLKSTRRTISNSNTSSNIANSPSLFSTTSSLNSTTSSYHDHMSNSSSHEVNNIPKPPPLKGTNCSVSKKSSFLEDKTKRYIALCMLWIISLLVLILWGKFFAILCTSIWFYFVPFRQRRKFKGVGSYRESEFDSVRYKKKIIMEGILERSHSRASLLTSASSTPITKS
ncbi:uncharacterized protein At5g23160-like [Trifolium pratense]|nr:uncharacterized protein At5g23160-like [Trifolium pratense]